jgi:Flp pilus assembly protein TadD
MLQKGFYLGAILIVLAVVAYLPALTCGFIWDDDIYITKNQTLRSAHGLRRIWFDIRAEPQYYPLTFTSFWAEYHLWELNPPGYHATNIVLHALNALLLWLVLRWLAVPGAWLAGALFALHPVQVESVAWVTERKNVLSAFFYLCAALAYLRFALPVPGTSDRTGGWGSYALAVGLFLCALLSKTVACSLPAALLLVLWWKRERVSRRDLLALAPLFALGVALGLVTVWMEKQLVGARGRDWFLSGVERCLVAGRALWFYAGKLLWPAKLTFIYPRWHIDARVAWQYVFPLGAVGTIGALWLLRQRLGKGPLVAVLFFAGTLMPALGFFDVYPMRFSFVADHFQYLASAGLLALAAAGIAGALAHMAPPLRVSATAGVGGVLLTLGLLTARQGFVYLDREVLWTDTIEKNPGCWLAHNNLGAILLLERNRPAAALPHLAEAVHLKPDYAVAHENLGLAFTRQGRLEEALPHLAEAVRLKPDNAEARTNLAVVLHRVGRADEAVAELREAVRLRPDLAAAHQSLAVALARRGDRAGAVEHFARVAELDPDNAEVLAQLADAYADAGRFDDALATARRARDLAAPKLARQLDDRLRLYERRQPYRSTPDAAGPER